MVPDVAGDWRLADARGNTLGLRTGRYDETPLDCGRSGCHEAITAAAASSPMTTVLARGLCPSAQRSSGVRGRLPAVRDRLPRDRRSDDRGWRVRPCRRRARRAGGFRDRLERSAARAAAPRRRRLPGLPRAGRAARGGGPLERAARRRLRDLPRRPTPLRPRRRVARNRDGARRPRPSGQDRTRVRRLPHDLGLPGGARHERTGTGCSPAAPGRCRTDRHQLRRLPRRTRPHPPGSCDGQHAPDPIASFARDARDAGGRRPTGGFRRLPAVPHAGSRRCGSVRVGSRDLAGARGHRPRKRASPRRTRPPRPGRRRLHGCHRSSSEQPEQQRGSNHGFAASGTTCIACHPQALPPSDLADRAQRLWIKAGGNSSGPAHAAHDGTPPTNRRTPRDRALWNLRLVLEDRGAAAHNAPYARALLAAAESVLR